MTDLAARARLTGVESRSIPFLGTEIREAGGGKALTFTGYASVTEQPYEMQDFLGSYTEVIRAGAFKKTLADGADVAFLLNHAGVTMARTKSGTLRLAEDSTGLHVEADLDPANPTVAELRSGIERGDLDEMSFAFRVVRQDWSPDYDQRDIQEVSMSKGDVSVVNYGANPHTGGLVALRGLERYLAQANVTELGDLIGRAAAQIRAAGGTISADQINVWLGQIAAVDNIVDELQEQMSAATGAPNPDDEETEMNSARWRQIKRRARLIA